MNLSSKDYKNFTKALKKINDTAGSAMEQYIAKNGLDDVDALVRYGYGVSSVYGNASSSLAAAMYDEIVSLQKKALPPAELVDNPEFGEVAQAIQGTLKKSVNTREVAGAVSRLVKRTGQDTLIKNGMRDGAEFAWIPIGDTCPLCITIASRGWTPISKKALKNGHAEHIHANCDCSYMIRHDSSFNVAGYKPEKYLEEYENAEGKSSKDKINSMRRMQYAERKDVINAQKRAAYALRTKGNEQEKKSNINDLSINKSIVGTKEHKDKFLSLPFEKNVNEKLYEKALDILDHRGGTDYEDMHLISALDGLVKGSQTKVEYFDKVPEAERHKHVWYNESLNSAIKNNKKDVLISIHNHPESLPPSGGDFQSQFDHGYKCGIIPCHNGDVYYYEVGKEKFSGKLYDLTVEKYKKQGYNETEAYNKTLSQFVRDYGIKWRKL